MLRLAAVICAVLVTSACSESTSIGGTTGGSFTLSTVNGSDLPAISTQGGTQTEVTSGSIALNSDHSWASSLTKRTTTGGTSQTTTLTDSGTWTQSNGAILLTSNTGSATSGTLVGGILTFTSGGAVYVYVQ